MNPLSCVCLVIHEGLKLRSKVGVDSVEDSVAYFGSLGIKVIVNRSLKWSAVGSKYPFDEGRIIAVFRDRLKVGITLYGVVKGEVGRLRQFVLNEVVYCVVA